MISLLYHEREKTHERGTYSCGSQQVSAILYDLMCDIFFIRGNL